MNDGNIVIVERIYKIVHVIAVDSPTHQYSPPVTFLDNCGRVYLATDEQVDSSTELCYEYWHHCTTFRDFQCSRSFSSAKTMMCARLCSAARWWRYIRTKKDRAVILRVARIVLVFLIATLPTRAIYNLQLPRNLPREAYPMSRIFCFSSCFCKEDYPAKPSYLGLEDRTIS